MEKIKKQVAVNLFLVIVSTFVIFFAKTYASGKLLNWKDYLGTDIIFVMITSLVTTIGWRFSESVIGHWLYNIIVCVILFLFTMEYGISMVNCNDILVYGIVISLMVFLVFYVVENVIIICHFKKIEESIDKLSYDDE